MMTEQIQKKRKKKKNNRLLLNYERLSREEILKSINDIEQELERIFKSHIGEEEAITPAELFERIYEVSPHDIDIFRRNYWWGVIRQILSKLRGNGKLFVINKGNRLYVLKTELELKSFEKSVASHVRALKNQRDRARDWVRERKWRDL